MGRLAHDPVGRSRAVAKFGQSALYQLDLRARFGTGIGDLCRSDRTERSGLAGRPCWRRRRPDRPRRRHLAPGFGPAFRFLLDVFEQPVEFSPAGQLSDRRLVGGFTRFFCRRRYFQPCRLAPGRISRYLIWPSRSGDGLPVTCRPASRSNCLIALSVFGP